ncbi:hypothetical protein C8R45DRAFT_199321 [Mycena sanguinolenta]|nr:hypothetical protein C8R45DRAFT_199321 [Mycena sanguinolenta]
MSMSHPALSRPFHIKDINPRPELTTPRALDSSAVRLPSYRELTAACGELPPTTKPSRSTLFTAGLIHLPPLKVPTSPNSPSSLSMKPPFKRRLYEEDDSDGSQEHRYLDLSVHCPLPGPGPRVGSPQSTNSASSSSSSRPVPWSPTPTHSLSTSAPASSSLPSPGSGVAYDMAQPRLKFSHAKAGGRTKKQALSCYFCRERKIACGRPDEGSPDGTCNQCARRKIPCRYPTVSHRGQHSRIKSAARKGMISPGSAHTTEDIGMDMTLPAQRLHRGMSVGS